MAKTRRRQQVSPNTFVNLPPWCWPEQYVKAAFELRIAMMAERSGNTPAEYQEMLRNQERAGLLTIMYMDDKSVIACWHDPKIARVLGGTFAPRVVQ
jgi:hypothetical protein